MAVGEPEQNVGNTGAATGRRHPREWPYFGIEWFVSFHAMFGGFILVTIWMDNYPVSTRRTPDAPLILYTIIWCVVNLVRKPPRWTWHQRLFVAVMLVGWPLFYWSLHARGTVVNYGGIPWEQMAPIFAIAYVVVLVARRRINWRPVFDHMVDTQAAEAPHPDPPLFGSVWLYTLWGIGVVTMCLQVDRSVLAALATGSLATAFLLAARSLIVFTPAQPSRWAGAGVPLRWIDGVLVGGLFVLLGLWFVPDTSTAIRTLHGTITRAPTWLFWLPAVVGGVVALPLMLAALWSTVGGGPWRPRAKPALSIIAAGAVIGLVWTVVFPDLRFRLWHVQMPFIGLSLGLLLGMAVMAWRAAGKNLPQG